MNNINCFQQTLQDNSLLSGVRHESKTSVSCWWSQCLYTAKMLSTIRTLSHRSCWFKGACQISTQDTYFVFIMKVPYSSNRINCTESHCAVDHWFNAELDGLIFPSVWISVILPLLTYWTFHFFDVHLWKLSSVTLCFEREKDWPCISPPRRNLQESAGSSEHMMQPVCSTETPLQALLRSQQYRDPACGGGCSAERWLNLSYRYAFTL